MLIDGKEPKSKEQSFKENPKDKLIQLKGLKIIMKYAISDNTKFDHKPFLPKKFQYSVLANKLKNMKK